MVLHRSDRPERVASEHLGVGDHAENMAQSVPAGLGEPGAGPLCDRAVDR
jgi:hypothetical protein